MVGEKKSKEKRDTCKLYKTEISVTVNKALLERMPIHLLIVHRCFCKAATDCRTFDREHLASDASDIYSLALTKCADSCSGRLLGETNKMTALEVLCKL